MKSVASLLGKSLGWIGLIAGMVACGDLRDSMKGPFDSSLEPTPVRDAISALEEEAIVEFLNSPFATVYRLKNDLLLRPSVADSIVDQCYGKDGEYNTVDDEPITSLANLRQLDNVSEESIFILRDYVRSYGWVAHNHSLAKGSPLLDLTVTEGEQILQFVNTASEDDMNWMAGLSSQAVTSILNFRPIHSIVQLASLDFVGDRLFMVLRGYTAHVPCALESACGVGYKCTGKAIKGRDYRGRCRPSESLMGEAESCVADQFCDAGSICAGLSIAQEGVCVSSWMKEQFKSQEFIPIPDGDVQGVSSTLSVFGMGKRSLDIEVKFEIYHPNPAELRVDLVSPDGERRILAKDLLAEGAETAHGLFELTADDFAGISSANGDWTVVVADRNAPGMGAILSWELHLSSTN